MRLFPHHLPLHDKVKPRVHKVPGCPMALVFVLVLLILPVYLQSQVPAFQALIQNLNIRNAKTATELVYVHMDREVYAPGDTVWFKAYVRDRQNLRKSEKSQLVHVYLLDEMGNTVDHGRFLITDSNATGQFNLDHRLKEGGYVLAAYSSWMKNGAPDQMFHRQFIVRPEQKAVRRMDVVLNRPRFLPGDTLRASVRFYDEQNREKEGVGYRYRLHAGGVTYSNGRIVQRKGETEPLRLVVPGAFSDPLYLDVHAYWGENLDSSFLIPAIGDIQVDFFPEGGHRIRGLGSMVAYKAISQMGLPVDIEGDVINGDGSRVLATATEHDGMGKFFLEDDLEGPLYFRIRKPRGFQELVPLPAVRASGWQLAAASREDSLLVKLRRNGTSDPFGLLTLRIREHLVYNRTVLVEQADTLVIHVSGFPTGIAVLSLYDRSLQVRAERLIFIPPAEPLIPDLETDHSTYLPRDKVRLQIKPDAKSGPLPPGSYSISVVDVPIGLSPDLDEQSICTQFLMTPEIQGYIHNPGHYFKSWDSLHQQHLDLLLCTQGWRDYTYMDFTDWYLIPAPTDGDRIQGTLLKHQLGRHPGPAKGHVNVYYGMNSTKLDVGEDGRFMVTPEYSHATNSDILVSGEVDGSNRHVILDIGRRDFDNELPGYLRLLADSLFRKNQYQSVPPLQQSDYFSLGIAYRLWIEEVVVTKSRRMPRDENTRIEVEDLVTRRKVEAGRDQIETAVDVIGILYNMGIPLRYYMEAGMVEHLPYPRSVIGWVVDDFYLGDNYRLVQHYVPKDIERFTLVKGTETMLFGVGVPEVVASIRTRTFDPEDPDSWEETSKYHIPPLDVSRKFYNPLYDAELSKYSTMPDIRKTIYWNPDVRVGENGIAELEFYNGDRYTRLKCMLEGITDDGTPVYSEYEYSVGLSRE